MEMPTPPRAAGSAYEPNPAIHTTPAGAVFMSDRPPEDASDEWRDAHSKRRRNFWRDSLAFIGFLTCLLVIVSIGRAVIRFTPEQERETELVVSGVSPDEVSFVRPPACAAEESLTPCARCCCEG